MRVKVIYMIDKTTKVDEFSCKHAIRQTISRDRGGVIELVDGVDKDGRKVIGAHYLHLQAIYTYDED